MADSAVDFMVSCRVNAECIFPLLIRKKFDSGKAKPRVLSKLFHPFPNFRSKSRFWSVFSRLRSSGTTFFQRLWDQSHWTKCRISPCPPISGNYFARLFGGSVNGGYICFGNEGVREERTVEMKTVMDSSNKLSYFYLTNRIRKSTW